MDIYINSKANILNPKKLCQIGSLEVKNSFGFNSRAHTHKCDIFPKFIKSIFGVKLIYANITQRQRYIDNLKGIWEQFSLN